MPNVREFNAPSDLGLRPDSRADESLANSGRRIAALYNTAAEADAESSKRLVGGAMDAGNVAQKFMEHREISAGAAKSAETLANLDNLWNKTIKDADPNDPAVAAKFREEVVEPTLETLRDGFMTEGGQKFAESHVEQFRNHFVAKTSADMARLAGVAVRTNIETLKNQLSNAAINDPTSLKTSLGLVEHSVGAMVDSSPNLGGADAAGIKLELTASTQKEIVKAAAIGAIAANPEAGLKQFSAPEYSKYISGAELRQLEQQAKYVQRGQYADEAHRRTLEKQAKIDASDEREGQYFEKLHSGDPKAAATVSAKAIASDFTLTREARERLVGIVERESKPDTLSQVSNATATDLIGRMRLPEGDPRRISTLDPINDAYKDGKLNRADLKFLRDEFKESRTPEGDALSKDRAQFFKQYAGVFGKDPKGLPYDPQQGSPSLYAAEMAARRTEQDLRTKGLDPHLAYDPSSEYFFGKPARIQKFSEDMQRALSDKAPPPAAKADTGPPPSLRGIADLDYSPSRKQYRDRTSGKVYDASGNEVK